MVFSSVRPITNSELYTAATVVVVNAHVLEYFHVEILIVIWPDIESDICHLSRYSSTIPLECV